jgi:hypothetical protein
MALPLLAGIAVGSLAVLAFNNKKEIKEKVTSCATQAKEVAKTGYDKTKEFAKDSKESVQEKLDCIKSKDKKEVVK